MQLQKPPALKLGDTIAIVCASSPLIPDFKEDYEKGKQVLRDMGFQIKEGSTIGPINHWAPGKPQDVAKDINDQFADPQVKAIMSQTGGAAALAALPYLDYDLIKANPKPFIGFSDITWYHLAFYTKCGLVGFHGECVSHGMGSWPALESKQQEYFKNMYTHLLTSSEPFEFTPQNEWETWREGKATGHLIGGNLLRFSQVAATPWFPPLEAFDGAILFWEEIGQAMYDTYNELLTLRQLGIFDRIKGMILGKEMWVNEYFKSTYPTFQEMVLEAVEGYDFPILARTDFGHYIPNMMLPIGVQAEMDANNKTLKLLEGCVR
jgi:muramoyltetrapeptide carboxypeptidase